MNVDEADPSTILMVDDNATNLQVLFKTLQPAGHRLFAAQSGQEAIKTAIQVSPDLVLLDIMMPPGMDGFETLQQIKETDSLKNVPVIFLSSLDDTESKVKGLELGAVDYISKPFEAAEVMARVGTHLKLRRLQADLAERNSQLLRANVRMTSSLEAAGRLQNALLPHTLPKCKGYDFGWACRPCEELGGDALDVFRIDEDMVGFYLLDVSGHGVPASLLAVTATRSLQPRSDSCSIVLEPGPVAGTVSPVSPKEVVSRLNALNPMESDRNPHFITMIYGLLQLSSGRVRYVCAGHPGPIVVSDDGASTTMDGGSLPVGISRDVEFEEHEVQLSMGDSLFIHSDGLNEQCNPKGEELSRRRVCDALSISGRNAMASTEAAIAEVLLWAEGSVIRDDLSILALTRQKRV